MKHNEECPALFGDGPCECPTERREAATLAQAARAAVRAEDAADDASFGPTPEGEARADWGNR